MAQLKLHEDVPPEVSFAMKEKTEKTLEDTYSYPSVIYHADSNGLFPRTISPIYSSPAKEPPAPNLLKVSTLSIFDRPHLNHSHRLIHTSIIFKTI